jgi:hypothetical protein
MDGINPKIECRVRLRGTAARCAERPHTDVRAGRPEARNASPWMASIQR